MSSLRLSWHDRLSIVRLVGRIVGMSSINQNPDRTSDLLIRIWLKYSSKQGEVDLA